MYTTLPGPLSCHHTGLKNTNTQQVPFYEFKIQLFESMQFAQNSKIDINPKKLPPVKTNR